MRWTIGAAMAALCALGCASAWSQGFTSGSTGSDGALRVASTSGTLALDLPADGIFNFTTLVVEAGATLRFNRNALNTPVYLLATGNIEVAGTIEVSGFSGKSSPPSGGLGGPGGFDGGMPGILGSAAGNGHGPGGGAGGSIDYPDNAASAGSGSYGGHATGSAVGTEDWSLSDGTTYGSPLLVPLVGGSGGGGTLGQPGRGGAGGGGAVLLASNTQIAIPPGGRIRARGGDNDSADNQGVSPAQGSGGGVRLVAPRVSGQGTIDVSGGYTSNYFGAEGGHGRCRIDTLDRRDLKVVVSPVSGASVGSLMVVFPAPMPQLDIVAAAGQSIPEGTGNAVQIILPFDSPSTQTVEVRARNFSGTVPVDIVLVPDNGERIVYPTEIDMSGGSPATVTQTVQMPKNTIVHIYAWTR